MQEKLGWNWFKKSLKLLEFVVAGPRSPRYKKRNKYFNFGHLYVSFPIYLFVPYLFIICSIFSIKTVDV